MLQAGEDYEPKSALWRWKEHWSGESGFYRMGKFSARLRDYDGDGSYWEVYIDDKVVGSGEFSDGNHWGSAIKAAEDKLIELGALWGGS